MRRMTHTSRQSWRLRAALAAALVLVATLLLVRPIAADMPWAKPAAGKPAAPPVDQEWAGVNFNIDKDEWRDAPRRHRYVHGCFSPSHLCMSLYMPPKELYRGRFVEHMEGGAGGLDKMMTQPGWEWAFNNAFDDLGAYLVETNEGHYPDEGAGTINDREVWRANSHAARYSKTIAAEMYGQAPARGYVTGCSGGGARSSSGLEYSPDLFDGAVSQAGHGSITPIAFSVYSRMGLMLGMQGVAKVIDVADVGGSGDIFAGLSSLQSEALSDFLRLGWPRDAMRLMKTYWTGSPFIMVGQSGPSQYYKDFWTKPGYEGHDTPELLKPYLIDTEVTVRRVMSVRQMRAENIVGAARNPDTATYGPATDGGDALDSKPAAFLDYPKTGDLFLSKGTILTGPDAGKALFFTGVRDNNGLVQVFLPRSPWGFNNVKDGDKIRIDNRDHLAFAYLYRHGSETAGYQQFPELRTSENHFLPEFRPLLTTWGKPLFVQTTQARSDERNREQEGKFAAHQKLIYMSGTADEAMWPANLNTHVRRVRGILGVETDNRFRMWWIQGGPHCASTLTGPTSTQQVNNSGMIAQALIDIARWVEHGVAAPASTVYQMEENNIVFPKTAAERKGIQPVVRLTANGGARAEVAVGTPVTLTANAEVPPGTGALIRVEWDFDGRGTWPKQAPSVTGPSGQYSTTYTYDKPGVYFPAVRVGSRRGGVSANAAPVYNNARARVVVK